MGPARKACSKIWGLESEDTGSSGAPLQACLKKFSSLEHNNLKVTIVLSENTISEQVAISRKRSANSLNIYRITLDLIQTIHFFNFQYFSLRLTTVAATEGGLWGVAPLWKWDYYKNSYFICISQHFSVLKLLKYHYEVHTVYGSSAQLGGLLTAESSTHVVSTWCGVRSVVIARSVQFFPFRVGLNSVP